MHMLFRTERLQQRRARVVLQEPEDHPVCPAEADLWRVLAAPAALTRDRRIVLFVHVPRVSPAAQARAEPAGGQLRRK